MHCTAKHLRAFCTLSQHLLHHPLNITHLTYATTITTAGHNLTMTEEDYNVHRIMSFFFFAGWGSIPFLQEILRTPSPR